MELGKVVTAFVLFQVLPRAEDSKGLFLLAKCGSCYSMYLYINNENRPANLEMYKRECPVH